MARRLSAKNDKKKPILGKDEVKANETDDIYGLGLLRKLTLSAKSSNRKNSEDQGTSGNVELPACFGDITCDNVTSLKNLFDTLDVSHTGSLTPEDLHEGLKRIDSEVTWEEVNSVLKRLDQNGDGVINFDDFLFHMTQGGLPDGDVNKENRCNSSRRQRLLRTAITQKTIGDNLQYVANRQPHVLKHYTVGARLVGLTDRQVALQMKKTTENAIKSDSPYATPLQFPFPTPSTHGLKATHRSGQVQEQPNRRFSSRSARSSVVDKLPDGDVIKTDLNNEVVTLQEFSADKEGTPQATKVKTGTEKDPVPLPVLKLKSKHRHPSIDDLPNIRDQARKTVDEFYHNLQKKSVLRSLESWEKMHAETILPPKTLENFRVMYRAYSPQSEAEAFVVGPWIPKPCNYSRRRIQLSHHTPRSARTRDSPGPHSATGERRCVSSLY